jgi:hypothetical protein
MNQLAFDTHSIFQGVRYDSNSNDWLFDFSDSISVLVSGFWRLLINGNIVYVSMDHLQQFGMPAPVDMAVELSKGLHGKILNRINVIEGTGDLRLSFNDNIEMEALIISTGYESYQFGIGGKRYIALGGGEIAIS